MSIQTPPSNWAYRQRLRVLFWMLDRMWHLKYPRLFTFWEWVVMPSTWGGRLGFRNWLRYIAR